MTKIDTERALRKAKKRKLRRRKLLARLKHPISGFPSIEYTATNPVVEGRSTILVVSHQASRTGAPILALNIARRFGEKYNVVVFLIRGGELMSEFHAASCAVVEFLGSMRNDNGISSAIRYLAKKHNILFAVVNSLESRIVLRPLASEFIPTITLIHEFVSYTPDRSAPVAAVYWSTKAIYSAAVVRDNSIDYCPELINASLIILPQGQCLSLKENESESSCALEKNRLAKLFRPDGWRDDTTVILGAGSVQIRKGVDYFISCAKRVSELLSAKSCRFIWIGDEYNPDSDFGYSCYLKDQIDRSGLEKVLSILPPTHHIRAAYELADLMLISARLDPLPNVAVDGICMGMPVLCFDKTTGIADLLKDGELGDECVASYLDVEDMSQKIVNIVGSRSKKESIRQQSIKIAEKHFDMGKYVSALESIALEAVKQAEDEKYACDRILKMNILDYKFAFPEQKSISKREMVREYVRSWASGIKMRMPRPDFDPASYRSLKMLPQDCTDPLVHYIEAGQPVGPWYRDGGGTQ